MRLTPSLTEVHLRLAKIKGTFENVPHLLLFVVQQLGKNLHLISDEVARWRKILEVPYQEYLLNK